MNKFVSIKKIFKYKKLKKMFDSGRVLGTTEYYLNYWWIQDTVINREYLKNRNHPFDIIEYF